MGYRGLRDLVTNLAMAVLVFVLIRGVIQPYQVEQHSMMPTIRDGQHLLVNRMAYLPEAVRNGPADRLLQVIRTSLGLFGAPTRGDIVVFWHPRVPDIHLVKRVIGLPGERVEAREGRIYVDGSPLYEPYLRQNTSYRLPSRLIGEDEVYVLGDNRGNSYDSHVFGPIAIDSIVGKAIVIGVAPTSLVDSLQRPVVGHPNH